MLWINKSNIWLAFAATLFLMLSHGLSVLFAKAPAEKGDIFTSFAGGASVAYVFLEMLPNLVEYNKPIGEFLIENQWLTPFTELIIYIVSFAGFLLYYAMDVFAERNQLATHDNRLTYRLHLAMFCVYNILITYTMSLRALTSTTYTALFTIAMSLHFILTDRKLGRMYPLQFNHFGRSILITALFIGWFISAVFDPVRVLFAALLTAFLAGSILLNVFREELPNSNLTRFRWFFLGALLVTSILLLQTWVVTHH